MTFVRRAGFSWVLFLLLGQWQTMSFAQTGDETPSFTRAQATEGNKAYQQRCAACHGQELQGVGIIPALAGTRFEQTWRGKSAAVLSFHIRRMPPETSVETESLSEETYTNILAHILISNNFAPGDDVLPADLAALGSIAIPRLQGIEYDPVVPVVKSSAQTAMLNNLPAVTDEMLQNPSPSDWLHWGRTYSGQSYSPLQQINKANVSGLKAAWRAPLLHGSSMPMPLVHQGVMYLHTYPDTVLAMDASNGDVLWRYARPGLRFSN